MIMQTDLNNIQQLFRPQDFLINSSFFQLVAKISGAKLTYTDHDIPLLNKTSLMWSTDFYEGAVSQHHIGFLTPKVEKQYYIKIVDHCEEDLLRSYSTSFRRNVVKALGGNFNFKVLFGKSTDSHHRAMLFDIYAENMKRVRTFILPQKFFDGLFDLDGLHVKVYLAYWKNKIAGFYLTIGDLLYLNAARTEFLPYKVNNYLTHILYLHHGRPIIYQGTAFCGSGLDRFKKSSGTISLPCYALPSNFKFRVAHVLYRLSQKISFHYILNIFMKRKANILTILPYG